jgi:ELWxxDGT repeat protein/VCBS repeat-containing protein
LGDIDGDGITDLVFQRVQGGALTLTILLSDGGFGAIDESLEFLPRELNSAWVDAVKARQGQTRVLSVAPAGSFASGVSVNVLEFDGNPGDEVLVSVLDVRIPGDVNGDGLDDAVVLDPSAGVANLVLGRPRAPGSLVLGLDPTPDASISLGSAGIGSLSVVGDLNYDGYDEIVLSSARESATSGALFVFFGGANLPASLGPQDADLVIARDGAAALQPGSEFVGPLQATAGDMNGDGRMDLVIGEPVRELAVGGQVLDRNDEGRVYVFFSAAESQGQTLVLSQADARLKGEFEFDAFGSLSGRPATDLNGDGIHDLLIGAAGASGVIDGIVPDAGRIYVVPGAPALFDLPDVFDFLANLTVTGSGDFLVDEGTGRPAEFTSGFAPGESERWFRFTTLGDGRSGNVIALTAGFEPAQSLAPVDTLSTPQADAHLLEFDLGAFLDQVADPAALERVLLQLAVQRQEVAAAARPLDPEQLVASGGKLFFVATPDDGSSSGKTLWVTDGTVIGTVQLSTDVLDPANLVDVGGTLFFTANPTTNLNPALNTVELYTTDGTTQGTQRVMVDLVPDQDDPGVLPANSSQFTTDGVRLYFVADDTALVSAVSGSAPADRHGREVWVSDGTTEGTFALDSSAVPERVGIDPTLLSPTGPSTVFADSIFFSGRAVDANGNLPPGGARILWQAQASATDGSATPVFVAGGPQTIAAPLELVGFEGTQFFVSPQGALFWLAKELPPARLVGAEQPAAATVEGIGTNTLTFVASGESATIAYRANETQGFTDAAQLVDLLNGKIGATLLAGKVVASLDAGTGALVFSTVAGGSAATLQLDFDAIVEPAVVTAQNPAPATGQVTGASSLSFVINTGAGEVNVGSIAYSAADTVGFTGPLELAALLNARIAAAGIADRVLAGFDAASNRLTFSTVAEKGGNVTLRLQFAGTGEEAPDTLGFAGGQSAAGLTPVPDTLGFTDGQSASGADLIAILPQFSPVQNASQLTVVPGTDGASDLLYFVYSPSGQPPELWSATRSGVDAFGNPEFSLLRLAVLADAPAQLTASGGRLFFTLPGTGGPELWGSDGTEVGTTRIATFAAGSALDRLTDLNGRLFLVGDVGEGNGPQLLELIEVPADTPGINPLLLAPVPLEQAPGSAQDLAGVAATETAAIVEAAREAPAQGRVVGDGTLAFLVNEAQVGSITYLTAETQAFTSAVQLVAYLNAKIAAAGLADDVVAGHNAATNRLTFATLAVGSDVTLQLSFIEAFATLGFDQAQSASGTSADKLFFTAGEALFFTTGVLGETSDFLNVAEATPSIAVSVLEAEGDLDATMADASAAAASVGTAILPDVSGIATLDITERVRVALANGQTRLTIRLDDLTGASDATFDLGKSRLEVTTRAAGVLADLYDQDGARLDAAKSIIDLRAMEAGTYFLRVYDPLPDGAETGEDFVIAVKAPLQGDVHPQTDRDTIRGGDGDDLLVGNFGVDRLFGESGADAYRAESMEIRDLDGESFKLPALAEVQNQKARPVDVRVDMPDPALRAAIGEALGKPVTIGFDGRPVMKAPIFASDLAELTRLDLGSRGIADLTGLEYAINLRALNLTGNPVADVSELRPGRVMSGEAVGNLIGFPRLEALALDATAVADLLPLDSLPNLRSLSMDRFVLTASSAGPLQAEYFELGGSAGPAQFPDWSALEPMATRTDLQSAPGSFGGGLAGFPELQGVLGARWSGQLLVETAGEFTFTLAGGTAARLFIDDMATPAGPMAVLTASRDGPADGQLTEDLRFTLKQGEATALVELAAVDTEEHSGLDELIEALNEALLGSGYVAGRDGDRVTFTRIGAAQPIEVIVGEGDTGPAELGFSGKEASVLLSSGNATLTLGEGLHRLRYEVVGLNAEDMGVVLSWTSLEGSARLVFPDLDEALARIDSLRFLSLAHSALVDISALATLDGLEQLYLEGNAIRDINPLAGLAIVDDGDPGFTASGEFLRNIDPVQSAFEEDYRFAPASGAGTAAATWTFDDLNDGTYALSVTWLPHANRTGEATYTLSDVNGQPLSVFTLDQRLAPAGGTLDGKTWQQLGQVTVTGGVLRVTLQGAPDGFVLADAVRLERADGPVLPNLRTLSLTDNPLDRRAQTIAAPRLAGTVADLRFDANQAPQVASPGPQTSASVTGAVRFNGDDRVTVPHSASLDLRRFLTVEVTFTVEDFANGWMPLIYKGDGSGANGRSYTVWVGRTSDDSGFLHFTSSDGKDAAGEFGQTAVNTSPGSIEKGQTYRFTGVMDRATGVMSAYLDGDLVGRTNIPFIPAKPAVTITLPFGLGTITLVPATPLQRFDAVANTRPLLIGATHETNAAFSPFSGVIDEVRIWNVARSAAQIGATLNANLEGDEPGLAALWKFEESSGNAAEDATGRNDGTITSTTTPAQRVGRINVSVLEPDGDNVFLSVQSDHPDVVATLQGGAIEISAAQTFSGTASITLTAEDGTADHPLGGVGLVSFDFTAGANAIYGTKYFDADEDGERDAGELGLDGVELFLDANGNGVRDPGELVTYTDANGDYAFRGLTGTGGGPFTYTVDETHPPLLRPLVGTMPRGVQSGLGEIAEDVDIANVVNRAPVAGDDAYSLDEDTLLTVALPQGLLANDNDANEDVLAAVLVLGPQHGMLELDADGSFTYTPDADFNGQDLFSYRAHDSELSALATVLLTVNPINDAPAHEFDPSQSVDEDSKLVFSARRDNALTIRDVDAGADPVTVTLTATHGTMRFDTLPGIDHGEFTITDTVAAINNFLEGFVFVPAPNFNGAASIVVTTGDQGHSGAGGLLTTTDTIAITVNPVDDPTVAEDDLYAILEDGALVVAAPGVLGNDLEVDGDPLVAHLVTDVAHGALSFNPDGSFSYVPAADFNGADSFTYLVDDSVSDSNVATVTLEVVSVNDVPAFTKGPDLTRAEDAGPQAVADWATGITAGAANEAVQALTFLVETSNPGLFSALPAIVADGTLTFTSAADAHGIANVTVRLMDDGGTANGGADTTAAQLFTITILSVNDAPTFVKGPDLVVDEDDGAQVFENWATAISVGPADEAGQTYFFEVTNDFEDLFDAPPTLDASGTLRFAPKADAFGTATVSVVLRDSGGTANGGSDASAVQTFTITVAPLNDRPVAIGATFDVDEDKVLSDALTGFDVDGDTLTFSAFGPGPIHGTLALEPDGSFTYTPDADFFGTDTFGFRVSDGFTSSLPGVVTIHVAPINDAPVAMPESYDLVEDEPLDLGPFGPAFGVLANDLDVDGDPLTALLVSDAAHGTVVLNANGTFRYTPDLNFFGDDSFTYQARDPSGALSNVATVGLVVENQNDAPVASNVTLGTNEDVPLEALLPASDPDGDALTFEILGQPSHGMLELLGGGAFRYLPDADFFGTDSFDFGASDGLLPSGTGTVSIDVAPVNDPPVLAPLDDREVDEGSELSFTASASDIDTPAIGLSFSLVDAPAGAAIHAQTGLFTWTPGEVQGPGEYSFDVVVTDGASSDAEAITVTVNEVNLAPVLDAIGNRTVDEQIELSFTATASDPDLPANGLTFSLVGAPGGASIDGETGLFSWTPTEAQGPGNYTFDVVVSDDGAGALSDAETITVTVSEVNLPPVLGPIGDRTVSEGELLSFTIGASDPDLPANTLTFSAEGLPSGAAFDASTRTFSWMPGETQGPGSYAVTFRVSDGALFDEETIAISVTEDSSLDAGPQAGDGSPDTFRLVRNGADLEGYLNGALVFVRTFDEVTDLSVNGSTDDDTLIVDFSGGDPLPSSGLTYDGSGPGDHDALALTGGTVGSLVYTATDAHSGTVSVDGEIITYTGLEPITDDLAAASREFVFGAGDDLINVAIGASRTLLASSSSETVDFANPSGSVTIRSGDGDDTVVVTGIPAYELLIDAGGGGNTIVSSVPVGALVTGTQGADAIDVAESAGVLTIDVNGASSTVSGAGKLVVNALGGPDTVTLHALTIPATVDGGEGDDLLDASGVSEIGVVLLGGAGDDTLIAGGGIDTLNGGPGEDTAVLKGITPIAYWNLNETSGSAIADSAGAPQDGVFYGRRPDLDDPGPPVSLAPFDAQTGADFHDSRREYIAVAHDAAFEVAQGTIQLWFRTRDPWDNQTLFAKDQDGRSNGLRIGLDDRDLRVQFENGGSVHAIDTRNTAFNNLIRSHTWYQLTFTFGGEGMKLYVNGVLVGANGYTGGLVGNREPIVIGGSNDDNRKSELSRLRITKPFDGHIDEVAFYGEALTAEQIVQTRQRGAMGVIAPQDQADVLVDIERIEIAPGAAVFTAGTGSDAPDNVQVGEWRGTWPDLARCIAGLEHHGLRELFGGRDGEDLKLFGHTSAQLALFSVEGIALDKDARVLLRQAVMEIRDVDGWSKPARMHDQAPAQGGKDGAATAMATKHAQHAIDWNASLHGLGAGLSSGRPGGARGGQSNFADFDNQAARKQPKR